MKILVTGGCGFVGSNICLSLKKDGHQVSSLDNLSRRSSMINFLELKKLKINNYNIDISKFDRIKKLKKFDLIIDCCAEAAVEISKKDIDKVINTNLIGTFNILKKIKKDNSNIIFLSSSRIYPINFNKKGTIRSKIKINKLYDEKTDINGVRSIYGMTKLSSQL